MSSKHKGPFYYLNCFCSFRTENKLKSHEKVCIKKVFRGVVISLEKDKTLEFNQYIKSDIMPYTIYADIESLVIKIDRCANNPEKSPTTKIGVVIPYGYSISKIWAFDHIENKHTLYHRKDCIQKFCVSLREHAKNIIDFEKKNLLPLIKEELKSHQDAKACYICGKRILKKIA